VIFGSVVGRTRVHLDLADGTKTDKTVRNGFSFPQSTRSV
jgi:hypothetical protein